ncbi:MAG: hypothetical protein AB1758_32305 [Candidatus Eremiobacterota bacterium]
MLEGCEEYHYHLYLTRLRRAPLGKTSAHGMEWDAFYDALGNKHVVEVARYRLLDRSGRPRYLRRVSETAELGDAGWLSVRVRTYECSARPDDPGILTEDAAAEFRARQGVVEGGWHKQA